MFRKIIPMNPKIFVGAAVGAFAIILGIVAFSGQSIIDDVSEGGLLKSPEQAPAEILPLVVELKDISIEEINERAATIQVQFSVTNPNYKSIILQFVKYELFENGQRIYVGEIGERPDVFVTGSNYFTLLSGQPTILSDKIVIRNTGNTPELWDALTNNFPSWEITGEAYFNLSSMTSGGENVAIFEFSPNS